MRCDQRCNCYMAECRCCVVDVQLLAIEHRNQDDLLLQMRTADCGKATVLLTKRIVSLITISRLSPPLFLWRSSGTAAHPGVFGSLVMLVSLVSWIAAMLTLLLWRKFCSSVIFPLIPFAFLCISC